jgi:hypothetical protein
MHALDTLEHVDCAEEGINEQAECSRLMLHLMDINLQINILSVVKQK